MKKIAVLSMDFEEWYHLDYFNESYCDKTFSMLDGVDNFLELLDKNDIPSTFVLGELAKSKNDILINISKKGHEVSSHGWSHSRPINLSTKDFSNQLEKSKNTLEDIIGKKIEGYRASCFSIDRERLDIVQKIGFKYDSSRIEFGIHPLYKKINMERFSKVAKNIYENDGFFEFQVTTAKIFGKNLPISGGGYLRILPWTLMKTLIDTYLKTESLYVLYIHPFELSDRSNPIYPKGTKNLTKYRFSKGRSSTLKKLSKLIVLLKSNGYIFTTFSDLRKSLLIKDNIKLKKMINNRILITGISGFIGKSLFGFLESEGYEVWGIGKSNLKMKNYFQADLSKENDLPGIILRMPKFKAILHAAAIAHGEKVRGDLNLFQYNIDITRNVIKYFCKEDQLLIFLSSVAVYGEDKRLDPVDESCDLRPYSDYGKSKKVCEDIVLNSKVNNCIILRLCPVYDENNLVDIRKRVFSPIFNSIKLKLIPSPKYSLAHLNTVIGIISNFIKIFPKGKVVYNVSDKNTYSQKQIVSWFSGLIIPIPIFITIPVYLLLI